MLRMHKNINTPTRVSHRNFPCFLIHRDINILYTILFRVFITNKLIPSVYNNLIHNLIQSRCIFYRLSDHLCILQDIMSITARFNTSNIRVGNLVDMLLVCMRLVFVKNSRHDTIYRKL